MISPSQRLDRVMIRLPDGMRPMLKDRAKAGYRSLNAEIVSLIERGIAAEKTTTGPQA